MANKLKGFGTTLLRMNIDGDRNTLMTATQSYRNSEGDFEEINQEDELHGTDNQRLSLWHFVFAGYSRKTRSHFSLAWFRDGEVSLP